MELVNKVLDFLKTNLDKISGPDQDESKEMGLVGIRMLEFCYLLPSATH